MLEKTFAVVPRAEIFAHTGIQFMQLNSLYQLYAMKLAGSPALDAAARLLFMPDLFNYWLTGVECNELTEASTSQFYNPAPSAGPPSYSSGWVCPSPSLGRSSLRARCWARCSPTSRTLRASLGRRSTLPPATTPPPPSPRFPPKATVGATSAPAPGP